MVTCGLVHDNLSDLVVTVFMNEFLQFLFVWDPESSLETPFRIPIISRLWDNPDRIQRKVIVFC